MPPKAETGIAAQRLLVGLDAASRPRPTPQGLACLTITTAARARRIEFGDAFVGGVGVVDVVVGELLALHLPGGGDAGALLGRAVEARPPDAGSRRSASTRRARRRARGRAASARRSRPRASSRSRRRRRRCGHRPSGRGGGAGCASTERRRGVRDRRAPRRNRRASTTTATSRVVLRRGADHRRPADVDVLDALVVGLAGRDRRLERVEVDHEEVDRARCRAPASRPGAPGWRGPPRSPPWTAGCSVFTRPSIISGKPVRSVTSRTGRPASASALRVPPVETSSTPRSCERAREIDEAGLVGHGEKGARHALRDRSAWRPLQLGGGGGAIARMRRREPRRPQGRRRGIRAGPAPPRRGAAAQLGAAGRGARSASCTAGVSSGSHREHDLLGAPRAVGGRQKRCCPRATRRPGRVELPGLAIGQDQHHDPPALRPARLDAGREMEADDRLARGPRGAFAPRRRPRPRGDRRPATSRQRRSCVRPKRRDVAVMAGVEALDWSRSARSAVTRSRSAERPPGRAGRSSQRAASRVRPMSLSAEEPARRDVVDGGGRVGGRRAGGLEDGSLAVRGAPQLTTMRCAPLENSKERQPAPASADRARRRAGAPTSATRSVPPGLQALVAGMRRVLDRLAAHVVVGQQRREMVGGRHAHAVEMRQGAVAMAEQAHHRQHAVDRVQQRLRRVDLAAGEHLAQRQEIEQQFDQQPRDCGWHGRHRAGSGGRARAPEAAWRAASGPSRPSQHRPA